MEIMKKEGCIFTVIEGEVVILDFERGTYLGLRGASKEVWEYLENGPAYVDDLIDSIYDKFDNSRDEVEILVLDAISDLKTHDLLEIINE